MKAFLRRVGLIWCSPKWYGLRLLWNWLNMTPWNPRTRMDVFLRVILWMTDTDTDPETTRSITSHHSVQKDWQTHLKTFFLHLHMFFSWSVFLSGSQKKKGGDAWKADDCFSEKGGQRRTEEWKMTGQRCSWVFAFDKDHYGAQLHLVSWLLPLQKELQKSELWAHIWINTAMNERIDFFPPLSFIPPPHLLLLLQHTLANLIYCNLKCKWRHENTP